MATSLTLDTARSGDGMLVLIAAGEIDLSNVEPFSQALTTAVADADSGGASRLTVDLSGVEYLDSAAVNVLFPYAEHIRVIAHPFLVRIFDITGFSELGSVEPSPFRPENESGRINFSRLDASRAGSTDGELHRGDGE